MWPGVLELRDDKEDEEGEAKEERKDTCFRMIEMED
jgi:hypothetical protein